MREIRDYLYDIKNECEYYRWGNSLIATKYVGARHAVPKWFYL